MGCVFEVEVGGRADEDGGADYWFPESFEHESGGGRPCGEEGGVPGWKTETDEGTQGDAERSWNIASE